MSSSATSLLARLRAADQDALRELFRALAPQSHALAQRIAGAHAAEAILEEALILLWADPQRWSETALEAQALRCVRDLALAVRQRGISARAAAAEWTPPPIGPAPTADLLQPAAAAKVRAAVFRLDDRSRVLLEAAWFEGAPVETEDDAASLRESLQAVAAALDELAEQQR